MPGKRLLVNRFLFVLLFAGISFSADAKSDSTSAKSDYGNSIILSGTDFTIPHIIKGFSFKPYEHNFQNQLAIYYKRKVYNNWQIIAGYNAWNNFNYFVNKGRLIRGDTNVFHPGQLEFRGFCKMGDAYACYVFDKFKKHRINIAFGISYLNEWNYYIDSIYYNPGPPHDGIIYGHSQYKNYWGIVPMISYDFLFFRNRCMVGTEIRCRKYFGLFSEQIDYGFHLGFNF